MRRPGAPFNPLYLSGGGSSSSGTSSYAPSTAEFVSAPCRRPHSAMAAHPASRRLSSDGGKQAATDQDVPLMSSTDVKIRHLSLSRRIIELWDVLEIPPHRRQASIGSSMVLLHATAQHVTVLRQLIDELEAYRIEREHTSKLLFSSLGGNGSPGDNRATNHIYRSHPLDETPLHMRRPVSAALMRSSHGAGVPRKATAWSRPTSAVSLRSNMSMEPVTEEIPRAVVQPAQQMDVSVIPADNDASNASILAVTTTNRAAADADSSRVYRCAAAAAADASIGRSDGGGLAAPQMLGSSALGTHKTDGSTNAIGVAGPPLRGNTCSLVDASTMTIESYLVQDSAVVKELFRDEDIQRHDVTEQYARPMSKLYLLFLTRISDLEERMLRGLVRSDKEKLNDKTKDNALLDALTGGGSNQQPNAASHAHGVSASLMKKLTMDEAMQRVFLSESAERIAEIEFAILVTRVEEESRRSALCDVLEADSWRRLISFFITSLSTSLFQGLTIVPTAYLRRYDLEREEHFARVHVENVILRSLRVFTITDDLTLVESKARKAIVQEETIVDAVLSMAIADSVAAAYKGQFLKLAGHEQDTRSELRDALLSMLSELHQRFQRELADGALAVKAYADAVEVQPAAEPHVDSHDQSVVAVTVHAPAGDTERVQMSPEAVSPPAAIALSAPLPTALVGVDPVRGSHDTTQAEGHEAMASGAVQETKDLNVPPSGEHSATAQPEEDNIATGPAVDAPPLVA